MVERIRPNSLGELNRAMIDHQNQYEDALTHDSLRDILPNIITMRLSVEKIFGKKRIIIGGDQPMLPIPKMAAKLVAMKALAHMDDQIVTINLRADHDLALSELEILSMSMPHPGTDIGVTKVRLLSDRLLTGRPIISGVDLNSPEIFEYITHQLLYFGNSTFAEAYSRSLKLLSKDKGERDEIVLQAHMVIEDWLACYGIDRKGNRLKELPGHVSTTPDYSRNVRVGSVLPQVEMKLPSNLAEANENWYLWLQRQLGIEMQYTLSEGTLDRFLLQNGGLEILQKRWRSAVNRLKNIGYQPVTSKLKNHQPDATFFNVARDGQRYFSFFDSKDDSMLIAVDPLNKQGVKIPVQELIQDGSEWIISLSAIPRVVLYSLAGFAGHIKGGGSRYNYDAEAVTLAIGLPYFPLWNFTERKDGIWTSPLQYTSVATENALRRGKPHHTQKVRSISQAISEGKIYLLDLLLSINPWITYNEIDQWIEANGENIKRDDRIYITNLAGRNPGKL